MRRPSARAAAGLLAAAATLAVSGCGGAAQSDPRASGSLSSSPSSSQTVFGQVAAVWPVVELTLVTTPKGVRAPVTQADIDQRPDLAWWVEHDGVTFEQAAREAMDQDAFTPLAEQASQLLGDRYSALAYGDPEDDSALPWVAYTGDEPPPAALVALAEALPYPVELRGGAVMSDAEREQAQNAGLEAFEADVSPDNWGGGLDAPTGHYTVSYVPDGATKRADEATAAAMVTATLEVLGRRAPISVEFGSDDRDPKATDPATWFLPTGFTPDPAATSVEVLVNEQGCTSGEGAAGRMAEPDVEVTATQVRIAVSTYIRKGDQSCPGHDLAPLVVELGQPLGNRTLVDVNGRIDDDITGPGGDVVVPSAD